MSKELYLGGGAKILTPVKGELILPKDKQLIKIDPILTLPGEKLVLSEGERERRYKSTSKAYDAISKDFRNENMDVSEWVKNNTVSVFLGKLEHGSMVLDIGCGTGVYTQYMASMGHRVKGIDFSSGQIQNAKHWSSHQNATYEQSNFLEYRTSERYNGIFINSVLHHVLKEDAPKFLLKAVQLLKPNGRIMIIVRQNPKKSEQFELYRKLGTPSQRIFSYFNDEELKELFTKCGLKIEHQHWEPTDLPNCPFYHAVLSKNVTFNGISFE